MTTPDGVTASSVLGALPHLHHERATLVVNRAHARDRRGLAAIEAASREAQVHRRITLPDDERLRRMLDSGTYSIGALDRSTRVPIRQLGLAVAEQLV